MKQDIELRMIERAMQYLFMIVDMYQCNVKLVVMNMQKLQLMFNASFVKNVEIQCH